MATVVTVTFVRDENKRVRAFIYQDSPDYRPYGDYDVLEDQEVLELLELLGLDKGSREALLQQIHQEKTVRQQFKLTAEQEDKVRKRFFAFKW